MVAAGGAAWTSAVIASLQALTEAGAIGSLPGHICNELAQLAAIHSSHSCSTASTPVSPSELAYGDRNAGSGRNDIKVPPPLQQQENTQLQLWWAVATAATCGQLGLPSQLRATLRGVLADDDTADVAFELQSPLAETLMAHAAIIAASCPKLYKAVQQQQQKQQQCIAVDSAVHVQLGRSVQAGPFQQVLEYLYTGQVATLSSDEERLALRRLAHALELPQLAALASGRRPMPGADYTFLSLAEIMPSQHLQIPWLSLTTETDIQKQAEQLQRQQNKGMSHSDGSSLLTSGSDNEAKVSDGVCGVEHRQHPSIDDLHRPSIEVTLPDRLPVPVGMPPHLDLLLVPRQGRQRHDSRDGPPPSIASARAHAWNSKPAAQGQEHAVNFQLHQEAQADDTLVDGQQCLCVLPAHTAILSATSPYFAAMLSDRWCTSSANSSMPCNGNMLPDASRYLPAAHLPNEDMEVLSAFVQFCYTRELRLQPCDASNVDYVAANGCSMSDCCHCCWNARTAVRLSVAAEAWMVPMLQDECLAFLTAQLPVLLPECQNAVQADMTALHAWNLAHQLSIALDRI